MPDQHLQLHSSGHLKLHSSGHLKLWVAPSWHTLSTTSQGCGGWSTVNGPYDRDSINRSPQTEWASARSNAIAAFGAGSGGGYWIGAWVGASYNTPGAPRATCCLYGNYRYGVPVNCSSARIACSVTSLVGVFASAPTGAQMLSGTELSPASGYISLDAFLSTINACAASSSPVYVSVAALQPESLSYELRDYQWTNTTGSAQEVYGFTIQPGETLYWKGGGATVSSINPSISSLQLYY